MDGVLLVDKPTGITSHDVVDAVRKLAGTRQVGHAGTLDPLATGLLILGIGRATKVLEFFEALDKEYLVTVKFGEQTDTLDRDGRVVKTADTAQITRDRLETTVRSFLGEIDQVVPEYSAVRVAGKKLYEMARSGQKVQAPTRKVKIHEISVDRFESPIADIRVKCSKGCYVRAIARDVAERLESCATCQEVRRLRVGPYAAADSPRLDQIHTRDELLSHLRPLERALSFFEEVRITQDQEVRFLTGQVLDVKPKGELMLIVGPSGFLGIGQQSWNRYIKPRKVLK